MAFGFVITDDDNRVVGIVSESEFNNYKIVDDIERYEVGSKYPIANDLDEYQIVGCQFVDGINDNVYYFRGYEFYSDDDIGSYVLVDTAYGKQVAKIVELWDKEDFPKDILPEKDIVDTLYNFDEYVDRERLRKKCKDKRIHDALKSGSGNYEYKTPEKEELKKEKEDDKGVFVLRIDDEEKEKLEKMIEDLFNGWPHIFR